MRVAATWRPLDHLDPRWMGDPQIVDGWADGRFGPVVVPESRWPRIQAEPRARWVAVPDLHRVTAADLAQVGPSWQQLETAWTGRVDEVDSLKTDGRLVDVADQVALRTAGLRAVEPVVLLLLGTVGLVTLAALARLFASTHSEELDLLWARGASPGTLGGVASAETGAASVVGGSLGAAAVLGLLEIAPGPDPGLAIVFATCVIVVLVAGVAAAVVGVEVFRATARTAGVRRSAIGRPARLVGPGLVSLAVAAAALTVWQLRSYGSPVSVTAAGVPAVDPVAVAAPAALLVALVLAALLVFPVVMRLAERRAAERDVARMLSARNLTRRLLPATAPIVVVAITAATLVSAAAYARTWGDGFDRTRQLRAGADVHVATDGLGGGLGGGTAAIAGLDGVDAVAPVTTQVGGDVGSVLAVSPSALDALARGFTSRQERERAVAAITSHSESPPLPSGTERVRVDLDIAGLAGTPGVTMVLADPTAMLHEVPLDAQGRDPTLGQLCGQRASQSLGRRRTVVGRRGRRRGARGGRTRRAGRIRLATIVASGPDGDTRSGRGGLDGAGAWRSRRSPSTRQRMGRWWSNPTSTPSG